jgi:hypothetical protein
MPGHPGLVLGERVRADNVAYPIRQPFIFAEAVQVHHVRTLVLDEPTVTAVLHPHRLEDQRSLTAGMRRQ